MYLSGGAIILSDWEQPQNDLYENGYRLIGKSVDLGYWRKHPDLHGFIGAEFANVDDGKPIRLSSEHIEEIISGITNDRLPHTEGFFFGTSSNDPELKREAAEIFSKARDWLLADEYNRSVYYRACW